MTQMDFSPPKKGSGGGGIFKKLVGGGGLAVLVVVSLAIGWLCLEVLRQGRHSLEQAGASHIAWRNIDEGTAEAKQAGKLILYDFTAAWCGPCKMLDINVFSDEQVAKLINERFVPIRVMDRRQEDGRNPPAVEAAQEYFAISGFPTVIIASSQGTTYGRIEGFRDKQHVAEWLDRTLASQKQPDNNSASE